MLGEDRYYVDVLSQVNASCRKLPIGFCAADPQAEIGRLLNR